MMFLCLTAPDDMTADTSNKFPQKLFYLLVIAGIVINATGLFIPILEPDSALYASIAKRMALSNDWINLFGDGHDWLDKPHFPFWIAAASFKIFGISSFSYKLPAFIFWLVGIRYTFLLTRKLYNPTIASYTVVIYMTALHVMIANFDVRAESYLTSCTIAAIYYLFLLQQSNKIKWVLPAALFTAFAIMTKGIFILSTIGAGFIIYWFIKRDWKQFVNFRWWLFLILSFVFIFPELYAVYVQFDLHPEKTVFGETNVSGVKFFFWDSQFGRFFNTGPIKGSGDKSFFLHTTLWAFLPWSILFVIGIIQLFRKKVAAVKSHWIIYGSAAVTFILFSMSRFQLPHYILILFPHFAIIAAAWLFQITGNQKVIARLLLFHNIFNLLTALLLVALFLFVDFPSKYLICCIVLILFALTVFFFKKPLPENVLTKGLLWCLILYPVLNLYFYPNLFKYQSGMHAAKWLQKNNMDVPVVQHGKYSYSLEFYVKKDVLRIEEIAQLKNVVSVSPKIIYTTKEYVDALITDQFQVEILQSFYFFPISRLDFKFLNPKTRKQELQQVILARVSIK